MPSKIEWTEETWNPIAGCSDVSEGCRNCYARGMAKRLAAAGHSSRRQIEQWIRRGRVTVDGHVATLGERIGDHAEVRLDGQVLEPAATSAPRE